MSDLTLSPHQTQSPRHDAVLGAATSAIAALVLTSVHHAYGAIVYDTPWRLHILLVAAPAAALIAACSYFSATRSDVYGRLAAWFAMALIVAIPVLAIGVFEGGYNHLLKNVLFVAGAPQSLMQTLFPAPLYEQPNDLVFELTGVAQFVLGIITAALARRLGKRPTPRLG